MNLLFLYALLTALLQASILLGGTWLLLPALRRSSAARRSTACRLTMLAALLLAGASLAGHWFRTQSGAPEAPPAAIALPEGPSGMDTVLTIPSSVSGPSVPDAASPPPATGDGGILTKLRLIPGRALTILLGGLWLTGALTVIGGWLSAVTGRNKLWRKSTDAAHAPWLPAPGTVGGWHRVRSIRLTPDNTAPCVWGVWRPVLLLPAAAAAWSAEKLHPVLTHECAHLLRRDPLWQVIRRVFLAAFWFHPVAWSVVRCSRQADEQAADDCVLQIHRDAPSYAGLLVECARHFAPTPPLRAATHSVASPDTLARRVESILNPQADRRPASPANLLIWSVLMALTATVSSFAAPEIAFPPSENLPDEIPFRTAFIYPKPENVPADEPATGPKGNHLRARTTTAPAGTNLAVPQLAGVKNGRSTIILRESGKTEATDLVLEADHIIFDADGETFSSHPGDVFFPAPAIDPGQLSSLDATGSVTLSGTRNGTRISGSAGRIFVDENVSPGNLVLTDWYELQTPRAIKGTSQSSWIILYEGNLLRFRSFGSLRMSHGTAAPSAEAPPEQAPTARAPDAAPSPTESAPFDWKPVPLNGLDYLPLDQLAAFYKFPRVTGDGAGGFELRSPGMVLAGAQGSREISVNKVKIVLRDPVVTENGVPHISRWDLSAVIDPIVRPHYSAPENPVTTVVIDAGHGGSDSGAKSADGNESAFTLDTALRLQILLEAEGLKVILTRNGDHFVTLSDRIALAAAQENAILLSLHFNHDSGSGKGIRTHYPQAKEGDDGNLPFFKASTALAVAVQANTVAELRGEDAGVESARFSILTGQTKTPAIMIEGGYLSDPGDAAGITTESWRQSLAESIAGGVKNCLKAWSKKKKDTAPEPSPGP